MESDKGRSRLKRQQPPNKVPPGTPLSAEEEALCEELNLENRYFLRGKSQAKRRQRVKEIITRWKSVFTDETTKVGVSEYLEPFNIELEPSCSGSLETGDCREYFNSFIQQKKVGGGGVGNSFSANSFPNIIR